VQLAAIEGLLAEEPNNQELIGVRDQLRDIIRLASEVDTLQQPTTNMFDDDSSNEDERVDSIAQAQVVSEPDQAAQNIPKNLINFEKKEELHYKDGRMIAEQNNIVNNSLDDNDSESYSSSDYSTSDSENEQDLIAKEYLEQINADLTTNNSTEAVDGRFNQIAIWEQHTKGIGSKLLAKYGYKKGQGVGRSKIGITEPISLDEQTGNSKAGLGHTKRRRNKRLPGDERPSKRARKNGQGDVSQAAGGSNYKPDFENGENIFAYINKKTAVQSPPKEKEVIDLKKLKPEEVKKKHHELLKQLAELKAQIDKFEMSYQRNLSRDPAAAAQAKKQRDEVLVQYEAIGKQEKLLRTKIEMKKNRDKFKEF
jgi:hypothetical protein